MNKELENLFRDYAGKGPDRIVQLTSSGSHRTYYRLSSPDFSCIGVSGTDAEENDVFCSLSEHFLSKGIRVPKVYAVSRDRMSYIQQDLGDESLYDRLARGRVSGCYSDDDVALLKKTISRLPKIQVEGAEGLDFSRSLHGLSFSPRSIMFDLNYFKYCFLLTTGVGFNEDMLQEDFLRLSDELMKCMDDSFMYRDFQSRNVMIVDGEPYFIDFQGGRKGPLYYDVASFVWQARSDFPKDIKEGLVSAQKFDEAKAALDTARGLTRAAQSVYDMALTGSREDEKRAAEALARQAASGVAEVQSLASESLVRAPRQGEVTRVVLHEGEVTPAGFPLVTLLDHSDKWVVFNIREDELAEIKVGTELKAKVPALGVDNVAFTVYWINPRADYATWRSTRQSTGYDVRTFEVRARPLEPMHDLRPGMSVIVDRAARGA